MYSEVSQASCFDNTPEGQRYRIRVYRTSIRPDKYEIISIKAYANLNPR